MKEKFCKLIKKITFGKVCLKWCKTCDIKQNGLRTEK